MVYSAIAINHLLPVQGPMVRPTPEKKPLIAWPKTTPKGHWPSRDQLYAPIQTRGPKHGWCRRPASLGEFSTFSGEIKIVLLKPSPQLVGDSRMGTVEKTACLGSVSSSFAACYVRRCSRRQFGTPYASHVPGRRSASR